MGEGMIVRRGGGSDLNLKVVMQYDEPTSPKENMIWVKDRTALKEWSIGPDNPYIGYMDMNLINDMTLNAGYFGSSGGITTQNTTNLEVYTEEYANVEYGMTYEYTYKLSEAKSQQLFICEYKGDATFIKRTVLVNGVTGTYATGTYTPSSADVAMVRLSWRTFGDDGCSVALLLRNVEYTPAWVVEGSVWIKTIERYGMPLDIAKKNSLIVYPAAARALVTPSLEHMFGGWCDLDAYVYQAGSWVPLQAVKDLYLAGDQYESVTGGWVRTSGTLTVGEDSLNIKGSTGRMATTYPIDTTGFKAIEFTILATSTSATTLVGIGASQTAFTASAQAELGMTDYATLRVDVSELQGMYYAQVYTAASSVGCTVNAVRLVA